VLFFFRYLFCSLFYSIIVIYELEGKLDME
jgi:hypothetical protein